MSILRADSIRDRAGTGAPDFPNGLTGNVTGNADTATALSGTPNITVGTVTGTDATFSGNLTVNGTTTTIDTAVTAVDSLAVDGSIGIGDTTPENALTIKNIGSFDGDANSFYLGSNFTGTGANFSGSGKHAQRFFFNNASSNGYLKYENTGGTGTAGNAITWQERLRITSGGAIYINQQNQLGSTAKLEVTGTLDNTYPEYSYPIMVTDDAAYNSSGGPGGGIGFAFKQNSGGAYAQGGGIRGFKENTTDGNYAAAMAFYTRANGAGVTERVRITSGGTAIFKAGLAEKYNKGTTLAAASNNVALGSGNVHRFTSNESGAKTVNFTGVHATLADGESVSFTVLVTPANSGYINAATVDGVAPGGGLKWSGGSAPSAGSSGRDVYTFTIFKDGTATNSYEIFGAATNYA